MRRILLTISYDGTNYCGMQEQINGLSIQSVIQKALSQIAKKKIIIVSSGRTDAGVHALCQPIHFDFPIDSMNTHQIVLALNSLLPLDIRAIEVYEVSNKFHARFGAKKRTYHYHICKAPDPFNRLHFSFFPHKTIRVDYIKELLPFFLGKHDFSSFCKKNPDLNNYFCTIAEISFEENSSGYILKISANRFLHNMVRRIVGTVVNFSDKQLKYESIKDLLLGRDKKMEFIVTAPPQGLFLANVEY